MEKRALKKIMILTCILVCVFYTGIICYAEETPEQDEQQLNMDEGAMQAIERYLNSKLADTNSNASTFSAETNDTTFMTDAENRKQGFQNLEGSLNVIFENVAVYPTINEILSQDGSRIVADVYESTIIEYWASEESEITDIMGYGTRHILTLDVIEGEYQVIADSYDERLVTGACSLDMASMPIEEVAESNFSVEPMAIINNSYNVDSAIAYSNQYCGIAPALKDYTNGAKGNDDTYWYNRGEYTPHEGVDCANFVSQCLKAGGMSTDGTWYPESVAWVNARGLHNYLTSVGYGSYEATTSNVFPGNPVYFLNAAGSSPSGHQMICTGYNSAGVPVLDGHSPNMFRWPMTEFSNYNLLTIKIVDRDKHVHLDSEYYTDTYAHYKFCDICQQSYNSQAHVVIESGGSLKCSVCGYKGPFSAIISQIIIVPTE